MAERGFIARQTYETIEQLKAGGMTMADAVKQVATDEGKNPSAIRGNYYNHAKKLAGGTTRSRRSTRAALSVDDVVASARQLLEQARTEIDREIEAAKQEYEQAKARYDELVSSAEAHKKDLNKRIAALS